MSASLRNEQRNSGGFGERVFNCPNDFGGA